jgi:ElaB/YqjD/DUF883 family membrane-anchored ribosome-binding protein
MENDMENVSSDFTKEQLFNDVKVVVADAEALLKATAGQSGEKLAVVRAKAEQSIQAMKATIAETQAALLAKTREAAKATDVYVHENPWEAVGVAAAAGLVVGWLLGRR